MFDSVADHYDRARPNYPSGIFDALGEELGGWHGVRVLDVGAGTGIASRQLLSRGAHVLSIDVAKEMLRRIRSSTPVPACVLGDGNVLPIRTRSVQLVCFAQAWHWFDVAKAASEVVRVLTDGGCWAAWWSHPRADGEAWFDAYQDVMENACPGYSRRTRNTGNHAWADEPIATTGLFGEGRREVVPWTRAIVREQWIVEERSKTYVDALDPISRDRLLSRVGVILNAQFPEGQMAVPYTTHMWIARPSR